MKFTIFLPLAPIAALIFSGCANNTPKIYPTDQSGQILNARFLNSQQDVFNYLGGKALSNFMQGFLGKKDGGDCSGFVSLVNKNINNVYFFETNLLKFYDENGSKSQAIYNFYKKRNLISQTSPKLGDLVFFNNTTSQTKDKNKQIITHLGIIDRIEDDGTIRFMHNSRGKNKSGFINLFQKNSHKMGGKEVNSYIIACKGGDAACLTSNRFAGFGKVNF
ncbi:NlpC/P60 family protein [uncultured Campylobacter sp.]|uniref:NlpC/P60 family protein n=1 Tax=uncultured Campylobacter sp. TaxID=218934 RepID=UPI0026203D93|nr:NlpC/P60 family protein [uncultured Campylobacter sp.]